MAKTRQELDIELDALAAAAPYLRAKSATPEEFHRRLSEFVDEIKGQACEADTPHVDRRAAEIAESPDTLQAPHM